MEANANRVDFGRVFGEAFETYGNNIGPLLGGALIVIGIAGVIEGLFAVSGSFVLFTIGFLIAFAAGFLYTGYVVKLVQDVRDGRLDQSVGELLSAAVPYVGVLILNGILASIAIVIGLILLLIPGLILITIWAVIAPAIVVENRGVIEAFGRSRELVRGNGWTVFAIILVAGLIVAVISQLGGIIGSGIGNDAGRVIVQTIASVVVVPIEALVASILFFDLGGGSVATAPAEPTAPTG